MRSNLSEKALEKVNETITKEAVDPDAGGVHKKMRRKNVESRDAQTQTERSDYMLIKQRQQEKQKLLMQMISQKNKESGSQGIREENQESHEEAASHGKSSRWVDEYLDQQKHGLVQNTASHTQNAPGSQGAKEKTADFSAYAMRYSGVPSPDA